MPRRKEPRTVQFAKLALRQFSDVNPTAGPSCAFLVGFAVALGYARLVGLPSMAEQEAVSEEAMKLTAGGS